MVSCFFRVQTVVKAVTRGNQTQVNANVTRASQDRVCRREGTIYKKQASTTNQHVFNIQRMGSKRGCYIDPRINW